MTQRHISFNPPDLDCWQSTCTCCLISYETSIKKYLYRGSTSDNNSKYLNGKKWIEQILVFDACREHILFLVVCGYSVELKKFSMLGKQLAMNKFCFVVWLSLKSS